MVDQVAHGDVPRDGRREEEEGRAAAGRGSGVHWRVARPACGEGRGREVVERMKRNFNYKC